MHVQKGRLSEDEARFYAAEVVDALEYIHSMGLIHRDIKVIPAYLMQFFLGSGRTLNVYFDAAREFASYWRRAY